MAIKRNNARVLNWVDWTAFVIVIIGALNWGIIGLAEFDVVGLIFGGILSPAARTVFTIVGIAGLWMIYTLWKLASMTSGSSSSSSSNEGRDDESDKAA